MQKVTLAPSALLPESWIANRSCGSNLYLNTSPSMILFPWNSQNQDSFLTSLICHSWMEASHMYQNSLICDSHTYESHPIIFEPSFSSELFENYADKTNPTQSGTIMSMSMIFVAFLKTQISTHSCMWCFYPHRF